MNGNVINFLKLNCVFASISFNENMHTKFIFPFLQQGLFDQHYSINCNYQFGLLG